MKHPAMLAIVCLALATALPAWAQPMGMEGGMRGGPPAFLENLFPPGMIMRHQAEIGLSDAQRDALTKLIEESQKDLVAKQWDVERESEKLTKLLDAPQVDESVALAQADQVMNAEQRLKKTHLTLLLRIKNALTPDQQQKLRSLRGERHGFRAHRGERD